MTQSQNSQLSRGKTARKWLSAVVIPLLGVVLIPLTIGYLGYMQNQTSQQLSQSQHESDQKRALDQQRETTLKTYMDDIKDLLLNHGLRLSKPSDEVRTIAGAETLSTVRQLDAARNRLLFHFLQDAQLIGYDHNIISFAGTDLSDAQLSGTDLSNIMLNRAILIGADLSNANLSGANVGDVNLSNANLRGAIRAEDPTFTRDGERLQGAIMPNGSKRP